jgi:hypothetical protein
LFSIGFLRNIGSNRIGFYTPEVRGERSLILGI